jgi:hypothetical protein
MLSATQHSINKIAKNVGVAVAIPTYRPNAIIYSWPILSSMIIGDAPQSVVKTPCRI